MIPGSELAAASRRTYTTDGGRHDVECTDCDWTIPGHQFSGTPDRPGGADWADATFPVISAHVSTGHQVRVIITTWHANGRFEQSSTLIRPRGQGTA